MKKFTFLFMFAIVAFMISGTNAFGQIAQRGTATSATSTNTNLTITKPTGVVSGDVMLVNIAKNNGVAIIPSLAGWTSLGSGIINGSNLRGTVLYRVAGGSEPANYTFVLGAGSNDAVGTIVAFSGVDNATPINATGVMGLSGAAGGIATAAGITTTASNAAVVMFAQQSDNRSYSGWTTTSPGALAEIADVEWTDGTQDMSVGTAWATKAAAGATSNGTVALEDDDDRWGALLVALTAAPIITVNAGPDQLVGGTTVSLVGSTSASSPTYLWTKTSGPAGQTITTPAAAATTVTGLVPGVYVFRLTVNGSPFDEVSVRVITGTNLWASSSDGTQISSYSVSGGSLSGSLTGMFAPTYPSAVNTYSRTAALGRNDKTSQTSGFFYWLGTSDGGDNNGLVEVFGASAAGNSHTRIGAIDMNGGSGNELGFVRLGMGPDGTGWILAGDGTTLYLARFTSNGLNTVTPTLEDANGVTLSGGVVANFVNGDICMDATGKLFALANNGAGVTQIFIGLPTGATTTLTKKWDLVDPLNVPFTGSVNGVAFDIAGALYISTSAGLYYINPATVNGPAATVQCAIVSAQAGLQDLGSNVFPTTILLPVKMGDFTVVKQGTNALLNWQTLNEINVDHFEIERSYDGVSFNAVGVKQAIGNSADAVNYQYADPISISTGNIYYRLRTYDADGKSSLSKIVVLRLSGGLVKNFTVYPNPFTDNLKIQINSEKETYVTMRISNAAGQLVVNRNVLLQKGDNIIVLSSEIQTLKPGMHLMEIVTEDGKFTQKIIKR